MVSPNSVTQWIEQVKAGNADAAQLLWERYCRRLLGLARKRLKDAPRGGADEEDVALNAFASFCLRARDGRFPFLRDRGSLWPLLAVITARKAHRQRCKEIKQPHGGESDTEQTLVRLLDSDLTPADVVLLEDQYQRLLDILTNCRCRNLREIAVFTMEGDTQAEIARKLGCDERTVRRKLKLIQDLLEESARE